MYNSRRGLSSTTSGSPASPTNGPANPTEAFTDIRTKVLQRYGKIGLKAVGQLIRSLDERQDGVLNADELRMGLRDGLGVCVSDADFDRIAAALDTKKDGQSNMIDLKAFIVGLRGVGLSNRRKNVIEQAFRRLDIDNTGFVDLNELYRCYDVSRHPDVLARRASADQIKAKFAADFDDAQHPDGLVSVEEFVNYYVGVSSAVAKDDEFELLMIRSWSLDRPNNATAALAATRGSASGQDGVSSRYNANHGVPPLPKTGTASLNATANSNGSTSPRSLGNNTIGIITEDGAIARREHPLYQTAMMEYGKTQAQHVHEPKHHRPGGFTKNAPPFSAGSGLNTATTRSKVI